MRQETLTVVAPIVDEPSILAALAAIQADPHGVGLVFGRPNLGVHFGRIVHIPADAASASLVLESNFDTSEPDPSAARAAHLALLAAGAGGVALGGLLRSCREFPVPSTPADLASYCAKNLAPATATYQGHTLRPLDRIRLESHAREAVLRFMETATERDPTNLYGAVRRHLRALAAADPELRRLDVDAAAPALPDPEVRLDKLHHRYLPWATNIKPLLPALGGLPGVLQWDMNDVPFDPRASQESWTPADRLRFQAIAATEDHGAQNALTHVVRLRPGVGRLAVLRSAHAYIDRLSQVFFADVGQLGGIPTIHFAKWLLIDEGRRLLFLSNYDGSWESYLGDFVDQAWAGLNLAWSSTDQYPRTHALAFGGALDEETFKVWSRAHQVPTQIFYSAYPHLSVATVNNNTWIRHGLHTPGTSDLAAWFRRLT